MPVSQHIKCPHCQANIRLEKLALAGKSVPCPKCGETFVVKLPRQHTDKPGAPTDGESDVSQETIPATPSRRASPSGSQPASSRPQKSTEEKRTQVKLIGGAVLLVLVVFVGLALWEHFVAPAANKATPALREASPAVNRPQERPEENGDRANRAEGVTILNPPENSTESSAAEETTTPAEVAVTEEPDRVPALEERMASMRLDDEGKVVSLYLVGPIHTDADLELVAALPKLRLLSMSVSKITDDGLRHLTPLTNLRELDLANTDISDDGLEHLAQLSGLVKLNLTETLVTPAGVEELTHSLPNCEILYLARD